MLEEKSKIRVLVNGIGGPTPIGVAISLKRFTREGKYWLLGIDANPLAAGLYRTELFDESVVVPYANSANYWPVIERLVNQYQIEYAMVQPELEVLEWSRRQREFDLPCQALLPDYDLARILIDKSVMSQVLADTGLVPISVSLDRNLERIGEVEDTLSYPFWIRASSGSSGLGSLLVDGRESLISWVRINKDVESFLCSEYLVGRNLACKLLYFDGEPVRAACAERVNYIMAKVAPSGITGNTSFGRFLNDSEPVSIAMEAMERLFEESGARKHGFFTVDFKEDRYGKPRITEINIRNVAFNGCFAELGANFSEDIMRLLTEDSSFDREFHQYLFDDEYVFIRDVDVEPKLLRQSEIMRSDQ